MDKTLCTIIVIIYTFVQTFLKCMQHFGEVKKSQIHGSALLVGLKSTALISTVARHILFVPINIVLFLPTTRWHCWA